MAAAIGAASTRPLQVLLLFFAGWVNRQQADVIDYLKQENRALREELGDQPIRAHRANGRTGKPELADRVP